MLRHNECPLRYARDPLTSHMMTSSPRAPPPPLTLTGATFGTKQAQKKLNHPSVWTVVSQAGAEDSVKQRSFERGGNSVELLIYIKRLITQQRNSVFVDSGITTCVRGDVISCAPYVSPMCEAQRETCSLVIQPAGWNYSAYRLKIDTSMCG